MKPEDHVTIIGGGFSGTLLAINLVRFDGPRVTLVERSRARIGRGVAYGEAEPGHLLNVRAGGMSAFPDDPGHFAAWLAAHIGGAGQDFVPRRLYGAYLRDTLMQAVTASTGRLSLVEAAVTNLSRVAGRMRLDLDDGPAIASDAVVLALGNLPPHPPGGLDVAALAPGVYHGDPWSADHGEGLGPDDTVVLLGTGLTAVDVALTLEAQGFGGRVLALSRRGLAPRAHRDGAPPPRGMTAVPDAPLSVLLHRVRAASANDDWRAAVDAYRPITQRLWAQSDDAVRARFLRHLRPFWDVHRHRLAPVVAARIAAMEAAGRLRFAAGKITGVAQAVREAVIHWRPRRGDAVETVATPRIVNCTGPQGDLARSTEPFVRQLADDGWVRPDRMHLGIDTGMDSRVIGRDGAADACLYCIGPMTRGGAWEISAVPDLRRQSWDLARRLSNAHWVGGEGL